MQFSGIQCIRTVVQLSPPSASRTFYRLFQTETLSSLNTDSSLLHPQPWHPAPCFLSMNLTVLGSTYIQMESHGICPFVTGLFQEHNVLRVHLWVAGVRMSFLFRVEDYAFVWIFYILLIHPSINGHLGCLHSLVAVNNTAMNTGVQISTWEPAFNSFLLCPQVELLTHECTYMRGLEQSKSQGKKRAEWRLPGAEAGGTLGVWPSYGDRVSVLQDEEFWGGWRGQL